MEFKDYYATLGVAAGATQADIKRAYRKLARKFHPDVSKEPNAEARFKEVAEAHEALSDTERRAAYDDAQTRFRQERAFRPPPGRSGSGGESDGSFEFTGASEQENSDFFEALFGHPAARPRGRRRAAAAPGSDHHATVQMSVQDAYSGAVRSISLRTPRTDAQGRTTLHARQLEVNIPAGVRGGQRLRLAGQGGPGHGGAAAGDLYLEVEFAPDARFRVEGRDVFTDLPVAPWEAALGASVTVATPDGSVELTVPAASVAGRRLRLKGKGLPGKPPGDLYAVLSVQLPPGDTAQAQQAYRALAQAFPGFDARQLAQQTAAPGAAQHVV